jgi:glycine cleavage system H protein
VTTIRNCELPDELFYDVERDLWARREGDELVLGLTDVGQTRAGTIQHVSFTRRAIAGEVGRGESIAVLESAKWVGPVTAPLGGTVVATNEELLAHPKLVNLDPYERGWIVRIRPPAGQADPFGDGWSSGEAARARYDAKLRLPFRSVSGVDEDFWCVHCADWDV